jgi:hypothetical protein
MAASGFRPCAYRKESLPDCWVLGPWKAVSPLLCSAFSVTFSNLASGRTKLAGPSGNRAKGELPFH